MQRCRDEGRAALICYLLVGHPDVATSIRAMEVMVEAGADIIEVGIAYSDPLMDGPVNQRAAAAALLPATPATCAPETRARKDA
jgi:tryptophan synthase alpha chain